MKLKNTTMPEETNPCQEAVQAVAADFASQYTDTDINVILGYSGTELKNYLEAVAAANLEYAISILPGRPSRPSKPSV